jgi:hypothetical protein
VASCKPGRVGKKERMMILLNRAEISTGGPCRRPILADDTDM